MRIARVSSGSHMFSPVRFRPNSTKEQNDLPEDERANLIMRAYGIGTDGTYNPRMAGEQLTQPTFCSRFRLPIIVRAIRYRVVFFAPGYTQTALWRHTADEVLQALIEGHRAVEAGFKTLEQGYTTSSVARILICQHRALMVTIYTWSIVKWQLRSHGDRLPKCGKAVEFQRDLVGQTLFV